VERYIIPAHRQSVEMCEALCQLICVSMPGDKAYGLFVVDVIVEGKSKLFLHVILHILSKSEAIAEYSFSCFCRQHEVKVDEPFQLLGQVDSFGKTKQGDHAQSYPALTLRIFFKQNCLETLFQGTTHYLRDGVLRL
jgi:hypothetical protein